MTHIALLTINADGVMITDQPTSGRILATSDDYLTVLDVCRAARVTRYVHRVTGERRTLSEAETVGCAHRDPGLLAWLRGADVAGHGSYAIPVTAATLATYGP